MAKSLPIYLFLLSAGTWISAMDSKSLVNIPNAASWTPLHTATSVGNLEAVKDLLAAGARIDSRALPSQRTPLMFSAAYNKNAIAQELLKNGALVNQTDNDHTTALHIICEKGHCELVETFILAGASVNQVDGSRNSPLHLALAYKDYSDPSVLIALQQALKKKSDAESAAQGFALHRACQSENADGLEELVLKGEVRLDEPDKSGNFALHYAAANTNPAIMKTLLDAIKKKATLDAEKQAGTSSPAPLASESIPARQSGRAGCLVPE